MSQSPVPRPVSPVPPPKPMRRQTAPVPTTPGPATAISSLVESVTNEFGTVTNNPLTMRRASQNAVPSSTTSTPAPRAQAPSPPPDLPPLPPPPPPPLHPAPLPPDASRADSIPPKPFYSLTPLVESGETSFRAQSFQSTSSGDSRSSTSPLRFTLASILRGSSQSPKPPFKNENVIMQGVLSKRNRDGNFERCEFIVLVDQVKYAKLPLTRSREQAADLEDKTFRSVPLETIVVTPTEESDMPASMKRERTFRFCSKLKSFLLKAKSIDLRDQWMEVIATAAAERRSQLGIPQPLPDELSPVWSAPELDQCQMCARKFSLLHRKHHCRNCGRCVCELCGTEKVRLPKLDERRLFTVCNPCGGAVKATRQYGIPPLQEAPPPS